MWSRRLIVGVVAPVLLSLFVRRIHMIRSEEIIVRPALGTNWKCC